MSKADLRKQEAAEKAPKPEKEVKGPKEKTVTLQKLEPIKFTASTEKAPPLEEIPEFQQKGMEAQPGQAPKTQAATMAEERKAGTSALASLLLPVLELTNKAIEGGEAPGIPSDPKDLRLNKEDAENLSQAILLVDAKHGGPLSKTLGSEEGPEIYLAAVCLTIGVKLFMLWRISAARRKAARPPSAASQQEQKEKPKTALEKLGESFSKLTKPREEAKAEEEPKPEGTLSDDQFLKYASEYQKQSVVP